MPLLVADRAAHLTLDTEGVHRRVKTVTGSTVTIPLRFDAQGAARVRYAYDGPRFRAPMDPRTTLYFRIQGPQFTPR